MLFVNACSQVRLLCARLLLATHVLLPRGRQSTALRIPACLCAQAPPLSESLGNLDELIGRWSLEDMVTVGRKEYVVESNYKFLMQVRRVYHVARGKVTAHTLPPGRSARVGWGCKRWLLRRSMCACCTFLRACETRLRRV